MNSVSFSQLENLDMGNIYLLPLDQNKLPATSGYFASALANYHSQLCSHGYLSIILLRGWLVGWINWE